MIRKLVRDMIRQDWKQGEIALPLRSQISEYVKQIVTGVIPGIPLQGYLAFRDHGSRKESEEAYFTVRKQLTALGTYLQWEEGTDKEKDYFNELLWSVANEFTWCLAAHLPYGKEGFLINEPEKIIDLFSAETAATLGELLTIHKNIIDPYVGAHIRKQIDARIFTPFLEKEWGWETSKSNWCAVCSGCLGMAALYLEQGDRKKQITDRVDLAFMNYLNSFGEDGACEEGIGYWTYGFGYYIYYTALRQEQDADYHLPEEVKDKVKKIAEFPRFVQIAEDVFLPFSDAGAEIRIPTGLLSYLQQEFGIVPPVCKEITSFDFDHCYRYAHISRNLWWTQSKLFKQTETDFTHYFSDKQWLVQKKNSSFFAVKGGSNAEEHNHNDVGSFVLALGGVLILTDLGAGPYTAGYFSSKRYQYSNTRSYWHNLPLLQGKEQISTANRCEVQEVYIDGAAAKITMELSKLYEVQELQSFRRNFSSDLATGQINLTDEFSVSEMMEIEEGFISTIKPGISEEGIVVWEGKKGNLKLRYDSSQLLVAMEEAEIDSHLNERIKVYRVGLRMKTSEEKTSIRISFSLNN